MDINILWCPICDGITPCNPKFIEEHTSHWTWTKDLPHDWETSVTTTIVCALRRDLKETFFKKEVENG